MRATEKLKNVYTGYVWANTHNCKACWACVDACPKHVIGKVNFLWHKHIIFKNSKECLGCKKCIKPCPYLKNTNDCIGCKKCIKTCSYGVFSEETPNIFKEILSREMPF